MPQAIPAPSERSLQGKAAAFSSWAKTADPTARTAPARLAADKRFLDQVDPERKLPEAERNRRVAYARKSYFADLARKSAKARRRAGAAQRDAIEAEVELAVRLKRWRCEDPQT